MSRDINMRGTLAACHFCCKVTPQASLGGVSAKKSVKLEFAHKSQYDILAPRFSLIIQSHKVEIFS